MRIDKEKIEFNGESDYMMFEGEWYKNIFFIMSMIAVGLVAIVGIICYIKYVIKDLKESLKDRHFNLIYVTRAQKPGSLFINRGSMLVKKTKKQVFGNPAVITGIPDEVKLNDGDLVITYTVMLDIGGFHQVYYKHVDKELAKKIIKNSEYEYRINPDSLRGGK